MELTKSFPPADAFVEMMMEVDYKKLWTNVLTIGAVCAVILQLMYQQLRKVKFSTCLLYTSPSPRDRQKSRMPSSA